MHDLPLYGKKGKSTQVLSSYVVNAYVLKDRKILPVTGPSGGCQALFSFRSPFRLPFRSTPDFPVTFPVTLPVPFGWVPDFWAKKIFASTRKTGKKGVGVGQGPWGVLGGRGAGLGGGPGRPEKGGSGRKKSTPPAGRPGRCWFYRVRGSVEADGSSGFRLHHAVQR
jgi:hypothetical protein